MGMYILCPYFKRERKKSITCEDTIRSYATPGDKRRVLKAYCTSEWKRCPVASTLEEIYARDLPEDLIKELIMENTIESMKKEINNLMRENGQLMKKIEVLKDQIDDRDKTAEKNHEMYIKSLKNKDSLIKAKDEQIKWLESLASAFLIVAYGEDIRQVTISKEKLLKLMTEYKLTFEIAPEDDGFIFNFEHIKGAKS